MSKANNIYSSHFSITAAAGGAGVNELFNIPFPNRWAKIESISLELKAEYNLPVPGVENLSFDNPDLRWWFLIGSGVIGNQIANPMIDTAGGNMNAWGEQIHIYKPGQLLFKNFYCQHLLPMELYCSNMNLVNDVLYRIGVIVELEIMGYFNK